MPDMELPHLNMKIKTGHWKATGYLFGKFIWKILCKNLDLKGRGTGAGGWGLPLNPPFKIQIVVTQ